MSLRHYIDASVHQIRQTSCSLSPGQSAQAFIWLLTPLLANEQSRHCRSQENPVWSFYKLFGQFRAKQIPGEVSGEPDTNKRGLQKDGQPKSASLRDSTSLKQQRLISPRKLEGGDADGASTSADIYEGLSTHRSSTYSDRRRLQAEQEDPSKE